MANVPIKSIQFPGLSDTYKFLQDDTTLSVSGAAADAKVTGDKFSGLDFAKSLNKYSLLTPYAGSSRTHNGITYAFDDKTGTVTVSGTASGISFANIFQYQKDGVNMPVGMVAGGVYQLLISGATNAGIRVGFYTSASSSLGAETYFTNSIIVVPDNAGIVVVRAQVEKNVTVNNETIHFAILNAEGHALKLRPVNYVVHDINLPPDTTIEGCGAATTLTLNPNNTTSHAIKAQHGCTIKDVKLLGPGGNAWTPDGTITASHGIYITGAGGSETNRNRINISGVEVSGFSGGGICIDNTGVNYDDGANIVNCYLHNNNAGIYIPKKSEFNRIANVSAARNYVGCVNNGGNNLFANCGFNGNRTGLLMDSTGITTPNDSHGAFVGCNFAHSHAFDSQTTLLAVQMIGQNYGEIFSACSFGKGNISIADSVGVVFSGCNFLVETAATISGGGLTLFDGCVFKSVADSPLTTSGTAVVKYDGCYLWDGTPFDPAV